MKCLIVSSNRWNSAVSEYALGLARSLQDRGVSVVGVFLAGAPVVRRANFYRIRNVELPAFRLAQRRQMQSIIDGETPSHIIVCEAKEEILISTLKIRDANLVRFRGQDFRGMSALRAIMTRLQSHRTVGVLFPSLRLNQLSNIAFSNKAKASIPVGIDSKKFFPNSGSEFSLAEGLVIFGRLDPVKGHRSFVQIYARAKKLCRAAFPVLQIVGEPANVGVDEIKLWVSEAGLEFGKDVVLVTERLKDPRILLSRSLIGVISSIGSEEICRVAEEFLLCGTPVLVSGVGALPEVLFEGAGWNYHHGVKAEAFAAKLLSQAIEEARSETEELRAQRAKMAARVFSLESMGEQVEKFLRSL